MHQDHPNPNLEAVSLSANPRLPLLVLLFSLALLPLPLSPWPTLPVALFSLFLLLQTYSLRLEFCPDTLVVWRGGQELRRFPYSDWQAWRLFAPWLPGLLYFREETGFDPCFKGVDRAEGNAGAAGDFLAFNAFQTQTEYLHGFRTEAGLDLFHGQMGKMDPPLFFGNRIDVRQADGLKVVEGGIAGGFVFPILLAGAGADELFYLVFSDHGQIVAETADLIGLHFR